MRPPVIDSIEELDQDSKIDNVLHIEELDRAGQTEELDRCRPTSSTPTRRPEQPFEGSPKTVKEKVAFRVIALSSSSIVLASLRRMCRIRLSTQGHALADGAPHIRAWMPRPDTSLRAIQPA